MDRRRYGGGDGGGGKTPPIVYGWDQQRIPSITQLCPLLQCQSANCYLKRLLSKEILKWGEGSGSGGGGEGQSYDLSVNAVYLMIQQYTTNVHVLFQKLKHSQHSNAITTRTQMAYFRVQKFVNCNFYHNLHSNTSIQMQQQNQLAQLTHEMGKHSSTCTIPSHCNNQHNGSTSMC